MIDRTLQLLGLESGIRVRVLPHLLMWLDDALLPSQALPAAPQIQLGGFCTGVAGDRSQLAVLPAALAPANLSVEPAQFAALTRSSNGGRDVCRTMLQAMNT